MSLIKGEAYVIYGYFGGQWKPWVCGRVASLTSRSEFLETAKSGQGIFRTYVPVAATWGATFEGLVYLDMDNTMALPDIRAFQLGSAEINVRLERTDTAGNTYVDEGYVFFEDVTDTGSYDGMATWSVTMKGNGALNQTFVPTPINPSAKVNTLYYTGIADELFFTDSDLNLVDIVSVSKDGVVRGVMITAGTPVNQEFKYTSNGGLGRIEFPQPIAAGEIVTVQYQEM